MSRTTRKQVEGMFLRFCTQAEFPMVTEESRFGLCLDYAPEYGGYMVRNRLESGGESDVFGSERRSASDMWSTLYFATTAVFLYRTRGEVRK